MLSLSSVLLVFTTVSTVASQVTWPKIYILGDQYVESCFRKGSPWCANIADNFGRTGDVVVRGVSDYNSKLFLSILGKAMMDAPASQVALVVIFLGTVDSYDPVKAPRLSVPITEYRNNLRSIVKELTTLKSIPKEKLMFVTGPPAVLDKNIRPLARAVQYCDSTVEVAKELGISWLDLRNTIGKATTSDTINDFFDSTTGVFSEAGSNYFFKALWPVMQVKLRKLLATPTLVKKFPPAPPRQ